MTQKQALLEHRKYLVRMLRLAATEPKLVKVFRHSLKEVNN